jgi:hypothetical protein
MEPSFQGLQHVDQLFPLSDDLSLILEDADLFPEADFSRYALTSDAAEDPPVSAAPGLQSWNLQPLDAGIGEGKPPSVDGHWERDEVLEDLLSLQLDPQIGAYRPPSPCSYCKKNRLSCFIIRTTRVNPNPVASCSSCVALFRECSLSLAHGGVGGKRQPSRFETQWPVVGQLHGVNEEALEDESAAQGPELSLPCLQEEPAAEEEAEEDASRLSRNKRTISRMTGRTRALRNWFSSHLDHPYPSKEEKAILVEESGLSATQVDNWFTNERRRRRHQEKTAARKAFPQGSPKPSRRLSEMTPLERWRNSPPEEDHLSPSVLETFINSSNHMPDQYMYSNTSDVEDALSDSDWVSRILNSGSDTESVGLGASSNSVSSFDTAYSASSSQSLPYTGSRKRKEISPVADRNPSSTARQHPYQCTFCDASFKRRFDWCRHEKSVHISLDFWVCRSQEHSVWHIGKTEPQCTFCGLVSPTQEHIASHDFETCAERPEAERTFARKDHLWQHLKKFHHCESWTGLDLKTWRTHSNTLQSRCGFCQLAFYTWSDRQEHLAHHFKKGLTMSQWVGDWGFSQSTMNLLRQATLPAERKI